MLFNSILKAINAVPNVAMKFFGVVFFACCMFFLAFVMLGSSPLERINRGCTPVDWGGRAATTVAAVFSGGAERQMRVAADEAFQGCRFFMFRQFYADRLEQMRAQAQAAGEAPEGKEVEGGDQ